MVKGGEVEFLIVGLSCFWGDFIDFIFVIKVVYNGFRISEDIIFYSL